MTKRRDPFYTAIIHLVRTMFRLQGVRFSITGQSHVPATGGAVVVINHTGYLDFMFAGVPVWYARKRLVRFMAKKEVFDNAISGPLMRAMRHIPVDRSAGQAGYQAAVEDLKAGEMVGIFPEATISRSFELKTFKTGAARMAAEADVPLLPLVIWGSQRVWTKGQKKNLGRTNTPVHIQVGEPVTVQPGQSPEEVMAVLHARMEEMLLEVQAGYDQFIGGHPEGAAWVPARLGGGAPTLEDANEMDAAEQRERAEQRRLAADNPTPAVESRPRWKRVLSKMTPRQK